ncbi:MAG: PEGA domain-containing protein, partial [Candidatus Hydrothermarchaeaceae archaeon]
GDVDEALSLISYSPGEAALKPGDGENLTFSMEAEQSDGASPSYSWELDGVKVSDSREWEYAPDYENPALHTVVGIATDGKLNVSQEWVVEIGEFNESLSVTIISPKFGDILVKDADITWSAIDPDGGELTIDISYSTDDGETWSVLASGEENDGIFTWDTRDANDGEYVLKIATNDTNGTSDESRSGSFFVRNSLPEVEFTLPAAGVIAGVQEVTWHASDVLDRTVSVVLSVSSDRKTWQSLASGEGNHGSFSWDTLKVSNGRYTLRVVADNKAGKTEQTLEVTVDNREYGTFHVSSTPSGASIVMDGRDLGKTDREVEILADYHTLEIRKEGYFPWAEWIEVKKGRNPDINVRLTPNLYGFSPAHIFAALAGALIFAGILFYVKGRR